MQTTADRCKAWHPEREHHEAKCEDRPKQTCLGLAWPCKKQGNQHCEYGHLKTETARANLQTASEFQQPSCSKQDCQEHHECCHLKYSILQNDICKRKIKRTYQYLSMRPSMPESAWDPEPLSKFRICTLMLSQIKRIRIILSHDFFLAIN